MQRLDARQVRKETPALNSTLRSVHLDAFVAPLIPQCVYDCVYRQNQVSKLDPSSFFFFQQFCLFSSQSESIMGVRKQGNMLMEEARANVAALLGCRADDMIITGSRARSSTFHPSA
jgi:selenocysteine lyase/cysteine desulfurase